MSAVVRRVCTGAAVLLLTATTAGCWQIPGVEVPDLLAQQSDLCAEFTDAVGLFEGNSVAVLGISVGRITGIENAGDRVRVRMRIDGDIRLPESVGAATVSDSLLTDRHIELAFDDTAGPQFDRSRCIPLERTRTPKSISELYSAVDALTGALGPGGGSLGSSLQAAAQQVDGQGAAVNDLLAEASAMIGDPYALDGPIRTMIDQLATITADLDAQRPLLQQALEQIGPAIDTFNVNVRGGIRDIIIAGSEFSPVLGRVSDNYYDLLMTVLDLIVPVAHSVVPLAGPIRTILELLPQPGQAPTAGAPR